MGCLSLTAGLMLTLETMTLPVTHPSLTILSVCTGSVAEIDVDVSDTWRLSVIHFERVVLHHFLLSDILCAV